MGNRKPAAPKVTAPAAEHPSGYPSDAPDVAEIDAMARDPKRVAAQESLRVALEKRPGIEADLGDVIAYLADEPVAEEA